MTEQDLDVVDYEVRGAAAWITLNRPHVHNALSMEVLDGVHRGLERASEDSAVRAVVIAANGRMFCAGADLTMAHGMLTGADLSVFLARAAAIFEAVAAHPTPVIAAVQGGVIAGGLELVLACDLVVAAEQATFCDGHARYGLFPAAGGATRLPRRIGVNRAKQLLFTAESWSAERMREAGLVNEVVPADRLHDAVAEVARRIARLSPTGLRGMKQVVDAGSDLSLPDALALELAACREQSATADFAEGLASFAERREPAFTGE